MAVSIPRSTLDAQLAWAENFVSAVTTFGVGAYGMTAAELVTSAALTTSFRTEFDLAGVVGRIAVNPGAYTQPGRALLYVAAVACIDSLAELAVRIQADSSINEARKIAAGIVPRNFTRPPRTLPVIAPTLQNKGFTPGATTVRAYNDVGGVARPVEANGVQFEVRFDVADGMGGFVDGNFVNVDDPVIGNLVSITNPSLITVQRLAFRGRYYGSRGQVGPWSPILLLGNL